MNRKMKDSGIEWIGEIPEEWERARLKDYYRFEKGKNAALYTQEYLGANPGPYPVYSGQTENDGIMGLINTFDYEIDECLFTTTVGAKVMSPKILKHRFSLSQNCLIMLKTTDCENRFFYYSLYPLFEFERSLIPTYMQPSLRMSDLNRYQFFIPSIQDQQAIANFLDQKCSEIDHILEKTRKSIEEYKKLKQSIITEAVTKGLNRNVEMKESGVEWIGEIPRHWEVRKIKHLFDTVSGATPKSDNSSYWDGNVVWITPADYKTEDVYIRDSNRKITLDGLNSCATKIAPIGSIVVSNRAPIGQIGLTAVELSTNQGCKTLIKKDRNIISKFVYYFLSVMSIPLNMLGRGTTFLELSTFDLSNFNIQMCSVDEQQQICEYLDLKCSEIDSLINQKETLLTDLEAYKKSLIFECVTGKREVM